MKKGLIITLIIFTVVVVVPLIFFKFLKPAGIAKEVGMILSLIGSGTTIVFLLGSKHRQKANLKK